MMKPRYIILIGVALLAWGSYLLVKEIVAVTRSTSAEGEVVQLIESGSVDDRIYTPVIEFEDQSGEKHQFRSGTGTSSSFKWPVGKEVEVLYNPDNPSEARIKGALWRTVFYLLLTGAGVTAVGVYQIRRLQKSASSQ